GSRPRGHGGRRVRRRPARARRSAGSARAAPRPPQRRRSGRAGAWSRHPRAGRAGGPAVTTWKSTRSGTTATLVGALFQGPADGGLFVPSRPPSFDAGRIARESRSFQETAVRIAVGLLGDDVPRQVLEEVVADALDFPVPLVPIGEDVSVLELFHGPTFAFKD